MPVSTRFIRRRIKSVTNTKKITKAMELVSSAKMRRATAAVTATRPYANLNLEMVRELVGQQGELAHPLLRRGGESGQMLLLAIFSDRGLCGGFNTQLGRVLKELLRTVPHSAEVVAVGKRGIDLLRRMGVPIVASFTELSNNPSWQDVRPISKLAIDAFSRGDYDEIRLLYTDFRSAVSQVARSFTLLPIFPGAVDAELDAPEGAGNREDPSRTHPVEYLFEPNPQEVLEMILPRLVETQVFQAILESNASEHSARMFAMRNASDAAAEMIGDLSFTLNQARQANITREISEISAGKAALE